MESPSIEIRDHQQWAIFSVQHRVDCFNYESMKGKIDESLRKGRKHVAVDLGNASFLSLTSIKYLSELAEGLKTRGGHLALLGPSEKLKRQIDTFASLDHIQVYRSENDLASRAPTLP